MGIETRGGRISTSRELPIAIGGFNLYSRLPMHPETDCNGEIIVFLSFSLSFFPPVSLHLSHLLSVPVRLLTFTFGHTSLGEKFYKRRISLSFESSNQSSREVVCASDTGWYYTRCVPYSICLFFAQLLPGRLLPIVLLYAKKIARRAVSSNA